MKFLLDTNVLIPLEPTGPSDVSQATSVAAKLAAFANSGKCELWTHPAQWVDVGQDRNQARQGVRYLLLDKYPRLTFPLGAVPTEGTNDWVDEHLISALSQNAVDFLVTEDINLTKRGSRVGLGERILTPAESVALIGEMTDVRDRALPNVEVTEAYRLDGSDPFWTSFRADYDGFDKWFAKCQSEHRKCFVLRGESSGLVGAAIVNHETGEPKGVKTLKICSLKVSEEYNGKRLGELLLKQVFKYAYDNGYDSLFVTTYPKHQPLIGLLTEFGFTEEAQSRATGEVQLAKVLGRSHVDDPSLDALTHHVSKGPFSLNLASPRYVVPIQPRYHEMLFPELQNQLALIPSTEGHANAIRKAYLCHSNTKTLPPGSLLLFYQSGEARTIACTGVVEAVIRSSSAQEIGSFVLPRTVYTGEEIAAQAAHGEVLAIRFRQCFAPLNPPIGWTELKGSGGLKSAPQSIVMLKEDSYSWLNQRLALP